MRLPWAIALELLEHARDEHPRECCGLLAGLGEQVLYRLPCTNIDHRRDRFEVPAGELLDASWRLEGAGCDLLAVYHSHAWAPAVPSPLDSEYAAGWGELGWLIIGRGVHGLRELRLWQLERGTMRAQPLELQPAVIVRGRAGG